MVVLNFGNKLKNRRKELKLTLIEVATRVGVTEATVQRWESGNIKTIRGDKLYKLASTLQVSVEELGYWLSGSEKATEEDIVGWDKKLTKSESEEEIAKLIEQKYGNDTFQLFSQLLSVKPKERKEITHLLSQYSKLDEPDRAGIRGAIYNMVESLLEQEKYSIQKESSGGKAM